MESTLAVNGANRAAGHLDPADVQPALSRAPEAPEYAGRVSRQVFQQLRRQADLSAFDSLPLPGSLRAKTSPGMNLTQCALAMGVSEKYLRKLETNTVPWTTEMVERYERAVGLDREDPASLASRIILWEVALARRPPGLAVKITEADRQYVARHPDPTYISNDWWDLDFANEAFYRWFPHLRPQPDSPVLNIIEYCLSETGRATLPEWERGWALPMLGQVRTSLASAGRNDPELLPHLEALVARLCRDPQIARLWEISGEQPFVIGPNGNLRRVTVAKWTVVDGVEQVTGREEIYVLLHTSLAQATANTRITTLMETRPTVHDPTA